MKKQAKEAIGLGVLVVIAATVWNFNRTHSAGPSGITIAKAKYSPLPVESSRIRWDKLEASRKTEYKSSGRNPFSPVPPAPSVPKILKPDPSPPLPPPEPPPPPPLVLPVKFFGFGTVPTRTGRLAFITDGEDVFMAGEGETLQGRFRILHIGNSSVDFEEISSGRRGSAPLEEQQGPPV